MELYAAVRRAVYVEGISEREASKRLARKTVQKMLGYAAPLPHTLDSMKHFAAKAESAEHLGELLGFEGFAANLL